MEKLKQISVKIDSDTLSKIDQEAQRAKWYKRNAVINGILQSVMKNADPHTIYELYHWWPMSDYTLEISVKICKKTK